VTSAPRLPSWTVLKDRAPFAVPTDSDALGTVVAQTRQDAQQAAELQYGRGVLVIASRSWPVPQAATLTLKPEEEGA
jgi:hypothetical protein